MLQQAARQVARDSWRPLALLVVSVAVFPALLVLLVLLLLLADCSVGAAGAVVVVPAVLVALVVLVVAAQAAVVARVAAAHTRPAMVVSVVMDGHWFWSFDHAAICSC